MFEKQSLEKINSIKKRCLENANNFISAAKKLDGFPSIQYHLASLAIEEIGKIYQCWKAIVRSERESNKLDFKDIDDHERKLFLAFVSRDIANLILKNEFEGYRLLAKKIHDLRLKSLYVNPDDDESPLSIIRQDEADNLIKVAYYQIKLEEQYELNIEKSLDENSEWFLDAIHNENKKKWIFGRTSLNKLIEFENNHSEWAKWLRDIDVKNEKDVKEILDFEISKSIDPLKKYMSKWKTKFRLFSNSHKIRQKMFSEWNTGVKNFEFRTTRNENEIICNMILNESVHINKVYDVAFYFAKCLLFSFNIASMGHFWFYPKRFQTTFCEDFIDMANKANLKVEPNNIVEDVFNINSLDEFDMENMKNFKVTMVYLQKSIFNLNESFLNEYYLGIALMGKNDIFLRFENDIFFHFYRAFKSALVFYFANSELVDTEKYLQAEFSDNDEMRNEFLLILRMADQIERGELSNYIVSLQDSIKIKVLLDMLIIKKAHLYCEDFVKRTDSYNT